ncbi:MAG: carotenoid 1,2-hydratase [Nitrospina sp.]|jgi:predicted secreted hydrolase|nr:carotenoid 1,2-hydratase [Nitrospina sp.]MBT3508898.1 carotenoid 1,2-hydratase [Nitrospina sp.]MBT3876920.1 carotenoid 1,2-hydratase [Nitrospina sp.]MBT4047952.1 carotenoid 1,2-hydratase [Nitrospina sp.]MBT4558860.1 carotenoid 1,2-hydratase [Nitrospina sp.]
MRLAILFLAMFCIASPVRAEPEIPTPFKQALPGYSYQFPRDDFSHDEFRIEWWYYTGNLVGERNQPFGYQLTFFRVGLEKTNPIDNPSSWKIDNIYFAHMTVSDINNKKFHFFERINRRGMKNAGADSDQLNVWNEDWSLTQKENSHFLQALEKGTGLNLKLTAIKKRVLHGKEGISKKGSGSGNASHYFSFPRMETTGNIFLKGEAIPVRGTSWMDHEFSSNQLNKNLVGWDWFSIKLDNQTEIMLYQLRDQSGAKDPHSSGTLILPDGQSRHILNSEFSITAKKFWTSPHTHATYPASWTISLPEGELNITPDFSDQELYNLRSISSSYWEGSVSIKGKLNGKSVSGKGYVELVGYQKPLIQGDALRK